jgi:cellulose synthase/poly-beta-1,6-N-acetylglucosamine synthase-like glycosyltransferase
MTQFAAYIFYTAIVFILFAYLFYPGFIFITSLIKKKIVWHSSEDTPSVAFLISIYNEEKVIRKKLENTLALIYPKSKLCIYLISDASTDRSNEIIKEFAVKEKNIRTYILSERSGKNEGINFVKKFIKEEIVVFSDANCFYKKDALLQLVKPYTNKDIGCVIGDVTFTNINKYNISETENTYWKFEKMIKRLESKVGKVIIGNGAILSIRKELLPSIPAEIANDLFLPVIVRNVGYHVIFNFDAIVYESSSVNSIEEYNRKVRIITRGITALFFLYHNTKFLIWMQLLFRKGLRWFVGYALLLLYLSNLWLISWGRDYLYIFIGQSLFYLIAFLYKWGIKTKPGSYAYYYCLINLAGLRGTLNKLFGKEISTWNIPASTRQIQ